MEKGGEGREGLKYGRETFSCECKQQRHQDPLPQHRPEDTPHYLNPQVLNEEQAIAVEAEEHTEEPLSEQVAGSASEEASVADGGGFAGQPPERIEAVLNSGMQFPGGLLEMATGKKLETAADEKPMIRIDRETGEVTLKFRLPV